MAACGGLAATSLLAVPTPTDRFLAEDNKARTTIVAASLEDLAFLRRVTVDIIGRIPTAQEIENFQKWPVAERRAKLVEKLLQDPRFADRWTVFLSDVLRVRSAATGGNALLAHLHKAVEQNRPWDELAREMISANGTTGKVPAVGFVLGEDADPMALAAATAQMLLGVRMGCAQCHNHPFDSWKQKQFYELATFFGKTRRVENRFSKQIYTTEGAETTVLWPPERLKPATRNAVMPKFPIELEQYATEPDHIKRHNAKKLAVLQLIAKNGKGQSIESLLDNADTSAALKDPKNTAGGFDVVKEARQDTRALDVEGDLYRQSVQRTELARLVTSPNNRYFARNMVNRLWADLMGRGLYEPVDNYQGDNVTHPKTLEHLADEFIASNFDLREVIKQIVQTDAYARAPLDTQVPAKEQRAAVAAFTAASPRRMLSEVLYDSIVIAGHLTELKWPAGANVRTFTDTVQVPIGPANSKLGKAGATPNMVPSMMAMKASSTGYDLEQSISIDFNQLLKSELQKDLEAMKKLTDAELAKQQEMMEMADPANTPRMRYKTVTVERKVDDNPRFTSTMQMATPAPPAHFLRVFGQPARDSLGDAREHTPSMRQQLMILNGKATHEAARVGTLEPMHRLLTGPKANVDKAIEVAYLEILTRKPAADELETAREIVGTGAVALEGMADLRWALLNSNEFRYLP